MVRLLITFLVLTVGLIDMTSAQEFSGQVYVMTESFTPDGCKPQIECDCCSSDIAFTTNNEFIMVDRCIHNDSYYRGTYIAIKEYLTLKFDQIVVKEIYNEATEEVKIEKRALKMTPAKFYITLCKEDDIILQRTDLKVLTKAFKESDAKGKQSIKELKNSKVWELLQ